MLQEETCMGFADVARLLPKINGRRINQSTIWRWSLHGCRGVKLETLRLGGRNVTSLEAVERFGRAVAEQTSRDLTDRQSQREQSAKAILVSDNELTPKPSSALRRKQIERANRELDAAGIN